MIQEVPEVVEAEEWKEIWGPGRPGPGGGGGRQDDDSTLFNNTLLNNTNSYNKPRRLY